MFLLVDHLPGYALIGLFAAIAMARIGWMTTLSRTRRFGIIALVTLFCIGAALTSQSDPDLTWLRSYPVLISLGLAGWFAISLLQAESATLRLARLAGMEVPVERLGYMRVLTAIWLCFLLMNAAISAYTAIASSTGAWALYNGFISYVLMGLLFTGEYLVRQMLIRREQASGKSS